MKSCKRKHYEAASLVINLVESKDVIMESTFNAITTSNGVTDADIAWVDSIN